MIHHLRACRSCNAFAATEDPRALGVSSHCYYCAHAVRAHSAPPETAVYHVRCACPAEAIYPAEVLDRIRARH